MTNAVTVGVFLDLATRLSVVIAGKILTPKEIDELFKTWQPEILNQFEDNDRVTALEAYQKIWKATIEVSKIARK